MGSSQGNGAPAPFPSFADDSWIGVCLQPAHEVALVFIDQRKPSVAVEPEIKQKQPPTQPVPRAELAAFVGSFVSELELCERLLGHVVDKEQLCSGLIFVSRRKRCKEPMQPEYGCIGDHRIAELRELWSDGVWYCDLLERMREEVAQEVTEFRRESVVEAGASHGLVGRSLVDPLKGGDRAGFAVHGEAQDERPDEHRDIDRPLTLDGIALARDAFDEVFWKERSQSAAYECWREFGYHNLSLRGF